MKKLIILIIINFALINQSFAKVADEPFKVEDCKRKKCEIGMAYNEGRINSSKELETILLHLTNANGDPLSYHTIYTVIELIEEDEGAFAKPDQF